MFGWKCLLLHIIIPSYCLAHEALPLGSTTVSAMSNVILHSWMSLLMTAVAKRTSLCMKNTMATAALTAAMKTDNLLSLVLVLPDLKFLKYTVLIQLSPLKSEN